jgi:hypothetical protein
LLAETLDNPYLFSKCEKVYMNHPQSFSFSFKQLQFLQQDQFESLSTVQITVNDSVFDVNPILLSIVSDRFVNLNPNDLSFSFPQSYFACFFSFINVLKGNSINFNKYNLDSIFSILDSFDSSSLLRLISDKFPVPQTISESIKFLQRVKLVHYSSSLTEHFSKSISLLAKNLTEIPLEVFNSLSLSVLENIFSSEYLRIPNEDFLFELISHLIEIDSNRRSLYHFLLFPNVSTHLLKHQFSNLKVEDLDADLLEKIKSRLFFDFKTEQMKHLLKRYFATIEITNHKGIISFLRKQNPNLVSIKASSSINPSKFPAELLFTYDGSTFRTRNNSNSYIDISFPSHQVSISNYFIRSIGDNCDQYSLQHWILEGSNDTSQWIRIDSRCNETSLIYNDSEHLFQCEESQLFSHIRIKQTGKNYKNSDHLVLSFIEFSGIIVPN